MQTLIADVLGNLGIALFHSVWQGAIAFLAVIGVRTLTREKDSGVRYITQVFILFACFAAFLATFAAYQFSATTGMTASLLEMGSAAATGIAPDPASSASALALDQIFARYAPWFGMFWCIGFAVLSVRYAADYRFTQKLRRDGLSDVPGAWQLRFEELADMSGLSRYTGFFVSTRVNGPVTLGTLKPIILVPVGFFAGIPADQVEAILLHEIAHIRRNDYFINLLQTAIKTVFFYHPAITYICRKIDEDREYACDDYAIGRTNNPTALAKGLAAIRLSAPSASFAMAANGKDTPLLARLKRIAGHRVNRRGHGPFASTLAATALMIAVLASAASTNTAEASPEGYAHDGTKLNYEFKTVEKNGQKITAKIAADGTRWVRIHDEWHDLDRSDKADDHLQALAGGPDGDGTPTPPKPPTPPKMAHLNLGGTGPSMEEFERTMEQFEIDMEYFEAEMERYADELETFHGDGTYGAVAIAKAHAQARHAEANAENIERQIERQMEREERRMERTADRMEREAERQKEREHEQHRRHADMDDFQTALIEQLTEDGLIEADTSVIKFEMSKSGMKVNGTSIPDNLEGNYCQMMTDAGIQKSHQTKITIKDKGESISIHSHN